MGELTGYPTRECSGGQKPIGAVPQRQGARESMTRYRTAIEGQAAMQWVTDEC